MKGGGKGRGMVGNGNGLRGLGVCGEPARISLWITLHLYPKHEDSARWRNVSARVLREDAHG